MRIGVMGGSFDPIHLGHLSAASEVAHRFDLDKVIFVPTGTSYHKASPSMSSPEIRWEMVVAATADDPRFEVSRVDIDRPGPTFTIDTLSDLQESHSREHRHEPADWFFITGADALGQILTWRDPDQILQRVHLIGVTRPGHRLADPGLPTGAVTLVEIPALAISSTDIRDRVRRGAPIRYLVPDAVERLIAEHHLYSSG